MNNRFFAFLTHLSLSALIGILTVTLVFFVWYPSPLDEAVGVTKIFLMLLLVDVIMGPTLTLVVYKPNKPGLLFDLCVIVILQISALTYGMNTVFQGRPAFIVFNQDRFDIARLPDIDTASFEKAKLANNTAAQASWLSPRWVGALPPQDKKRAEEILFSAIDGGPDWPQLPELYVPLEQVKTRMLERARPLADLRPNDTKNLLANESEQLKWLPLRSQNKELTVLIDGQTANIVKVVDINPWVK